MTKTNPDRRASDRKAILGLATALTFSIIVAASNNNAAFAAETSLKNAGAPKSNAAKASGQPVYHWYDGDKRREIHMSPDVVAKFSATGAMAKGAPRMLKSAEGSGDATPVFTDATGGAIQRALPGGVLVRFMRPMTQSGADALLKPFGTKTSRPIGGTGSMWLVESASGMASLELANTIYESGLVKSAAPNWWKRRVKK